MKRTIASRAIGRGLAKVEPNSPNTMIAFAAKAGSIASDGDSKHSPFATALVEHLPKPGLDLRKAFGFVRDDVLKNTSYKQEPYVYGSLGGDDVPLVPAKPIAAGSQTNQQSETRRDYELALQTGDREAWEAFLRAYPGGYYADLAKVQLKKIAAEEARAAAAERARVAEQEKSRLAAEGARKAEQAKAAAEAKAAEQARLAAEKTQQVEQAKADAAEQARLAAERAAAQKLAAEKAMAERKAAEKAAAEKAPVEQVAKLDANKQAVAEQIPDEKKNGAQIVASLPPESDADKPALSPIDVAKSVQLELQRVGCLTAAADGEWNSASKRSLSLFNKYAGTKIDVKLASVDALDAIKTKSSRVCPLVCDYGYKAEGETCVKITCKTGYDVSEEGSCQRIEKRKITMPRPPSQNGVGPALDQKSLAPHGAGMSHHRMLDGEPPDGTISTGARVTVQSSACRRGQVLELIGGSHKDGIPRQKRCVAAN
jgi:hypothetical protein